MNKYEAFLNALGDLYYTIYSIDIVNDRFEVIKALESTKEVIPQDESACAKIKKLAGMFASEEYKKVVTRFVDINKWPQKFRTEKNLKMDYLDYNNNWRRIWVVPAQKDENGTVTDAVLCIRDIHSEKLLELAKEKELTEAKTDALTGFKNRKTFYEDLDDIKRDKKRRDKSVGLVFADINGLKQANDNMGHDAGDKLICAIGDILKEVFRNADIYRHGGDEFLVLSYAETENDFEEELELLGDMWTEEISAAIGSVWVDHMAEINECIAIADRRMYLDKNSYYQQKTHDRRHREDEGKNTQYAGEDRRRRVDANSLLQVPFIGLNATDEKRHYCVTDLSTGMTRWSKSAVDYFGLSGEYMANADEEWAKHIHPEDRSMFMGDIYGVLHGSATSHKMDYRAMNRYGEYVVCTCNGNVVPAINGEGYLFVAVIDNHGISELFDSVTGLANIYSFMRDTELYLKQSGHNMLMIIGINDFASINRAYGYEVGNKILKRFADMLRDLLGLGQDMARPYRMEGVKFCIAMHDASLDYFADLYKRIQEATRKGFEIDGRVITFAIAAGVVDVVPDDTTDEFTIIGSLEYILDESRHKLHGELAVFNNDAEVIGSEKNLELLASIRNSVFEDMSGFYLCYQPIIEAETGIVCGMEALLRWNKKPYGEVPPGVFIPWLENDPCFYELGNWVLEQALIDALPIVKDNPDFVVNVNVSAEQIERSGFRQSVKSILQSTHFPPKNLCMELTERVVSLDMEFLRGELEFFKAMGIQVALDDFGTGVSSLNLLLELPVDHLKIDRSFVKDILTNKTEQILVETIANCASGMNLDVCAEGIETVEMQNFLMKYKIKKHQGYFYSKPIIYEKLLEFLKEGKMRA